jgi:hypothetical protein
MSFTYDFTNNPQVAYVRLLIPDTQATKAIFSDEEITAFYYIQSAQFQSSMKYTPPAGALTLPSQPVSYLRVAALALDSLANNAARLGDAIRVLDVDIRAAAKHLRDAAAALRTIDDESGAFAIIEQTPTQWAFADRWWKQAQRQSGGLI